MRAALTDNDFGCARTMLRDQGFRDLLSSRFNWKAALKVMMYLSAMNVSFYLLKYIKRAAKNGNQHIPVCQVSAGRQLRHTSGIAGSRFCQFYLETCATARSIHQDQTAF